MDFKKKNQNKLQQRIAMSLSKNIQGNKAKDNAKVVNNTKTEKKAQTTYNAYALSATNSLYKDITKNDNVENIHWKSFEMDAYYHKHDISLQQNNILNQTRNIYSKSASNVYAITAETMSEVC